MHLNKLHDGARQPFAEGPSPVGMVSVLGIEQGRSEDILDLPWHGSQGLEAGADEVKGFAGREGHGVI